MGAGQDALLCSLPEVQLHKVVANQAGSQLLDWGPFNLWLISGQDGDYLQAQVKATSWPISSSTPTLKANAETYTFALPNGVFYSIIAAPGVDRKLLAQLDGLLYDLTAFEVAGRITKQGPDEVDSVTLQLLQADDMPGPSHPDGVPYATEPPPQPSTSQTSADLWKERIANGAKIATEHIAVAGAYASKKIYEAGVAARQRTTPNAQPAEISPKTQARLKRAKTVTTKGSIYAVQAAGIAADLAFKAGKSLARQLTKDGTRYNDERSQAAKQIATASLGAAADVFDALEAAAKTVLRDASSASTSFVHHKYGEQAAVATDNGLGIARDVAVVGMSMRQVGMRKLAVKVARETAKGIVRTENGQLGAAPGNVTPAQAVVAGQQPSRLGGSGVKST